MFVINPDPFLTPSYRISPLRTADLAFNAKLPHDNFATAYFNQRFGEGHWQYTFNGRQAIKLALEYYNPDKNDLVTILTTSQNLYISSCVTSQIENVCRWNREIVKETKLVLVNHEFGYPHPEMESIGTAGLPVIEDCCTTFFSQDEKRKIGKYGDFSVYSLPKFFALQFGGIIVSNQRKISEKPVLGQESIDYLERAMSFYLKNEIGLLSKRNENFEYAARIFSKLGFTQRFQKSNAVVPSALMLNNNGIVKDLPNLKAFLASQGIQNSVFYGEDAFFIPSHQNLDALDSDYFYDCLGEFLKTQ